jgi:hypothetical protein
MSSAVAVQGAGVGCCCGDLSCCVCRSRQVTISEFRGVWYVAVREYYQKVSQLARQCAEQQRAPIKVTSLLQLQQGYVTGVVK